MTTTSTSPRPALGLRDFQQRTVDWVFRRLYTDPKCTRRFLIADEVGLGKTMVAKGLIARAVERLLAEGKRVDVIYVCSNGAIAQQNINRLSVAGDRVFTTASRLTLLAQEVHALQQNRLNFISFTPGTTFELGWSGGRVDERVLLYQLLSAEDWLKPSGIRNLLQGDVGLDRWLQLIKEPFRGDQGIRATFLETVRREDGFRDELKKACETFGRWRERWPDDLRKFRNAITGRLRNALARASLAALEPDLIILDEFQRFKDLLHGDFEAAHLARDLFDQPDARVLLLSATPYRMLTLWHEQDDDHYADFLETLGFLFNGNREAVERVRQLLDEFRRLLLSSSDESRGALRKTRAELECLLRSVMVRTERVGMTQRADAMLTEHTAKLTPTAEELGHAVVADGIARLLETQDTIEYWKSSPYVLNFLGGYDLRRKLDDVIEQDHENLAARLSGAKGALLRKWDLLRYRAVPPANARLRALLDSTVHRGMWRLLWLPPSMPYWQPSEEYRAADSLTKVLVFCAWNLAPDAIATLCSYEAERRVVELDPDRKWSASEFHDRVKPLLQFRRGDGRLSGMPTLALLYPSTTLAGLVDPLTMAVESGNLPDPDTLVARIAAELQPLLDALPARETPAVDQRWYWGALAQFDRASVAARAWSDDPAGWAAALGADPDELAGGVLADHLAAWRAVRDGNDPLGRKPEDLAHVLAQVALASPAVCALRSLHRAAPDLALAQPDLLSSATTVADGFRTLFNNPETIVLLRGGDDDGRYWRLVLQHGIGGNLQSVLDEQCHVLVESLGVVDAAPAKRVNVVAEEIARALSIRTAPLTVDDLSVKDGRVEISAHKVRCRFALRFGVLRDDDGKEIARADVVRAAFNSPFRPFVLASTSIGQEGLDFHTWCHAVVHWNLPTNPVDLEQREGRVHRYKGHAIRKNIARALGISALAEVWDGRGDPWTALFEEARRRRPAGANDLVPYWLYEIDGGATIERRIPLLTFSREVERLERLRRGLSLYRLAFGQPRQEDLLGHVESTLAGADPSTLSEWCLSLQPPDTVSDREAGGR